MTKFPGAIYVTEEDSGEGTDPWFQVHRLDDLDAMERDGQRVAVYQLVDDGRVKIAKAFVSRRKPRRSRRR